MPNTKTFGSRLKHAWNAFFNKDPTESQSGYSYSDIGISYPYRPDRPRFSRGNERSFAAAIFNRIALDAASINIYHVQLNENGRYQKTLDTDLNYCLTMRANLDQNARAFRFDCYLSLLNEGVIAIVPVDTTLNPEETSSYDILSMRVGRITEWYPKHVKVELYNENKGKKEEITLPKEIVSIIENPFYSVMNEPNSTMQRLIRKLNILDAIDEQSGSGKLDLIIQLPYVVRGTTKRNQAEQRRKDIENQLAGSKYGIAYTDGAEKITQLNRPVENNLLSQIEYLTKLFFSQIGITQDVMDGSANETTMVNYQNRIIEVLVSAIVDEMKSKFLTKTAITQGKTIMFFMDPFRLMPVTQLAETADKFTRNEIMTSNEFRQVIGMVPSDDPRADQLRNANINQSSEVENAMVPTGTDQKKEEKIQNDV